MIKFDKTAFAKILKNKNIKSDWLLEQLSLRGVEIKIDTIKGYRSINKTGSPSLDVIYQISEILDVAFTALLEDGDKLETQLFTKRHPDYTSIADSRSSSAIEALSNHIEDLAYSIFNDTRSVQIKVLNAYLEKLEDHDKELVLKQATDLSKALAKRHVINKS